MVLAVARIALGVALLCGAIACIAARAVAPTPISSSQRTASPHHAGWAMDAYPGDSAATLKGEMQRQIGAGADVVWLGHNNPGEVDAAKGEPGLSYAVWAAALNNADPKHADALSMIDAERNALEAARALGVQVVLPIGYQIQMGSAWNLAHCADLRSGIKRRADPKITECADLRRNPDLSIYGHGGYSATFYSPSYRRDILAYYHWIETSFVRPYAGTILMLNIGDEPLDGDYGPWADRAFRAAHGYGLRDAGDDPQRQLAVGRFESDYIADYAAWSATQWAAIDPAMKVTVSFCGGYGRFGHEGPNLERIFSEAPVNFVVTFDAYPRDGLYDTPLREGDITALFALVRTLGYYSDLYGRPLWLWSAGNSWGLNGASSDPGTIADAVANGIYLAQLVNQVGGDLQGIAVWNYNIKGQGLYNDTHRLTYEPDQMFARLSASFPLLRAIMTAAPGRPDTVVLAPDAAALRHAGAALLPRAVDSYDWTALAALARGDIAAPVLTGLAGEAPAGLRTAIVLARAPSDLSAVDLRALDSLLDAGGTVVAAPTVAALLAQRRPALEMAASGGKPALRLTRVGTRRGRLFQVAGGPVETIFADANAGWSGRALERILNWPPVRSSYVVSAAGTTLLYSSIARDASLTIAAPSGAVRTLTVYDTSGAPARSLRIRGSTSSTLHVTLDRRAYALLTSASAA